MKSKEVRREQKIGSVTFRLSQDEKKQLDLLLALKDVTLSEFFRGAIKENWQRMDADVGIEVAIEKYQKEKAKEHQTLQSAFKKLLLN